MSSPTQPSNTLPSSSVDLQEPHGTARASGTIQPKIMEQHPGTSAESSNGLVTNPQKLSNTDKQQHIPQQPSADTESVGNARPSPLTKPHPRLFALIIGINEYQSSLITNLLGAVPDADAVRDFLQKQLGVPSSQIRNLRNCKATRTAIIKGIEAFSLDDEIKEGDPILIYYAGHGGSAKTPTGWEVGGTEKIELLVPYDYSSPLKGGNPKHGIPDRTLAALLWQLAIKKGDNITVILDCCHSGSGTRNAADPTELVRGIDACRIPDDLDKDVWTEPIERGAVVDPSFIHSGLRSHVLLAACGSDESAIEQKSRGLFTQRLLDVLMTYEIDKLTYAGLLKKMGDLPSKQNPQCEGENQKRVIFNAKATKKSTVYHNIREEPEGAGYILPGVGFVGGISLGAEFEVYQNQDSELLGILVASEVEPFFTKLYSKEPESKFDLEGDGVARQTSAGTGEHILRIYVADEKLKALVKQIERTDPLHRIIQPVEQDQAEFGMAVEDGKVVFDIFDPLVTKYGLTRMSHSIEISDGPDSDANMIIQLTPVLRAADHFYWHLRRTPGVESDNEKGLADFVEIAVAEMEHDGISYDDNLEPILLPVEDGWKSGKEFDLQVEERGAIHGWKIINNCGVSMYPALFYFDTSDWSITSYYHPPSTTTKGIVDAPLKGNVKGDSNKRYLPVGFGDSGTVPHTFFLREDQNVDVGILKLFLSREYVDLSDVTQSTPFLPIGARYTAPLNVKPTKLRFLWDTILVPVVQRRAESAKK